MIYNNAIRSIRIKKCDLKKNTFVMRQCRTNNSVSLRRLEPRSIELSETVNLFIKQNIYFLSNLPNDLLVILSCTNISLGLLYFGIPNNLQWLLF